MRDRNSADYLRALSSADVSLKVVQNVFTELDPNIAVEIDDTQFFYKSTGAPSWVTILADAPYWQQLLTLGAGIYAVEILKEAGKDTWKNRGSTVRALTKTGALLRKMAGTLAQLRERLSASTSLNIGIPVPDEYFATRLTLVSERTDDIALELALFGAHLDRLTELIYAEGIDNTTVLAGVSLSLNDDGSLEVEWMDRKFQRHHRVLTIDLAS